MLREPARFALARSEPADLRLAQAWGLGQRAKNDALWALASVALVACRPLPTSTLRWLGRGLGLAALALFWRAQHTALANLARVYPAMPAAERRRLARRCFAALGEYLGEAAAMLGQRPIPPVDVDAGSLVAFHRALGSGRGVLFASAHLGPWERVAASLAAAGVPLVVLARESYDPRFTRLYARVREDQGVEVVWRARPGAAARILRTLRHNRVLGVPMDLRSRVASLPAPFLGHEAPTAAGPARIALRAGSPVLVGSAAPGPGESLVVTATEVETSDLQPDTEGARELTCRINAELSRRILALPHAWVWMHERWDAPARSG